MVREVRLPFPVQRPDDLIRPFTAAVGPRTRMAIVDHVCSKSALILPLAAICAALRRRGVPVLVDGAHAPGMLALELDSLGANWYAGNCHKWLHARISVQAYNEPADYERLASAILELAAA